MSEPARLTTVSCSNHHEALTGRLWDFMSTRHRVDIDLQWGERSIGVHQLIVEVFLSPEKLGRCALDDRNSILYHFLEFLYKGTVTVREEQLDNLLAIANELDFKMLADAVQSTRDGGATPSRPTAVTDNQNDGANNGRTRVKPNLGRRKGNRAIANGTNRPLDEEWKSPVRNKTNSCDRHSQDCGAENGADNFVDSVRETFADDGYLQLEAECDSLAGGLSAVVDAVQLPVERRESFRGASSGRRETDSDVSTIVGVGSQLSKLQRRKLWLQRQPVLKCDKCDYQNRCKTRFREHQSRHDPSLAAFVCDSCRRPFLCLETFERHRCKQKAAVDTATVGNKQVKLANEATTLARLERRKEWLQSQPVLRCKHCNYENRCKTRFQEHLSRHEPGIAAFTCESCGRPFLCKDTYERHRCKLKPKEDPPDIYECPHCDYKARKKRWFQVHLAKHDSSVNVFRCETCSKPFFSHDTLERHRLRHTIFKCPHCPDYQTTKSWCYSHHLFAAHQLNTRGETVRKIHCPDCDFSCQKESELKYHTIAKHSGDKPYKCHLCNFASGYKSDVPKHVKVAHLNIKPHMCEKCGYRTATAFKLAAHAQSHKDTRPFTCEICGQTYKDQGSFKRHVRRHVCDDKQYVCHLCGHPFNRRQNLKVHLKNVHKTVLDPDAFKKRTLLQL